MNVTKETCQLCGKISDFTIEDNAVLLREAKCCNCGASLRNSDVAGEVLRFISGNNHGLVNQLEALDKYRILNACSSGFIHNALKNLDNYTCSEYFDDIESGDYYEGVLCVDLCNIPFSNNTFDIIITEDIFEHILNYEKALSEILRVLKPGGCHIFTVPLHDGRKTIGRQGKRNVYHGDPIHADEGCLVITDWGDDIKDIVESFGYHVEIVRKHIFYEPSEVTVVDESYEEYLANADHLNDYLKYNSTVIIAYKSLSAYKEYSKEETVSMNQLKSLYQKSQNTIVSLNRSIRNKNDIINELNNDNEKRGKLIRKLDSQIEKNGEVIKTLQENEEIRNNHIKELDNELKQREESIQKLQQENNDRNNHIQNLDREIDKNREIIRELQQENSDRNNHIAHLDMIIAQNNNVIAQQKNMNESQLDQIVKQSELIAQQSERIIVQSEKIGRVIEQNIKQAEQVDQLSQVIRQKNQEIHDQANKEQTYEQKIAELLLSADTQKQEYEQKMAAACLPDETKKLEYEQKIADMRRFMSVRELELEELHRLASEREQELEKQTGEIKVLRQLTSEQRQELSALRQSTEAQEQKILNQQKSIEELHQISDMQRAEYEQNTADMQQIIRNKEGHIEQLLEVERAYEREKNTHAYHICKRMQKFGNFILPPDSRRRFFLRIVFNIFRHPLLMLHVINPKRIKNYLKYIKLEGMEGVKKRYEEAVDQERMQINPETNINLDLEKIHDLKNDGKQDITKFEKMVFPQYHNPKVSIIIPVYNEFHYTYNCLKSILKKSGDIAYEIIIADDCSTDFTTDIEKIIENITVITTNENVRFLLNCNNAATYAKGEYILFLNNDTQVQDNWLAPLVELIEQNDKIGMVGSKLVYPDGKLQEAGGILWKDGSAWNYGNGKNPENPEFNYVKETDYISGAAIMLRRKLWNEIGGFDTQFAPAYYEDTDLAFEVRKRGYKVMYQPLSTVVHFEGISNGTDVDCGQKHYQQVNCQKFYEKWKDVLSKEHEENGMNVFIAKDRSIQKKHILVVDHYVPHHDQDAGGKCTYMYLKLFVKMGLHVTFIGDNFYKHEPYTTELNQMGIEVLYGNYYYNNWQEWLKENSHYFDYIYLQRPHIAVKYIDLVKQHSNAKILYFAHDLHHIREYREYEMTKDPKKLASSENWKKIEYDLFGKADVGHVVGSYEQELMQKAFPDKPIRNIPLYIYDQLLSDVNKDFSSRHDILYVGGFGHPPNIDAVLWFAKEIFPLIIAKYPDIKWHIVGGKVPKEIDQLASNNIIIEGFVPDEYLENLYRTCRLAVVPLRFGAGVKGKVVEAAYFQIPLVTTSIGAEGLQIEDGSMLIENDAQKMADLIGCIYHDFNKLKTLSDNGLNFIRKYFLLSEAERVIRLDVDVSSPTPKT